MPVSYTHLIMLACLLFDPEIEIHPVEGQIDDLIAQIKKERGRI